MKMLLTDFHIIPISVHENTFICSRVITSGQTYMTRIIGALSHLLANAPDEDLVSPVYKS
jgi:hypothetical protein